jgi:hypothetical protein
MVAGHSWGAWELGFLRLLHRENFGSGLTIPAHRPRAGSARKCWRRSITASAPRLLVLNKIYKLEVVVGRLRAAR